MVCAGAVCAKAGAVDKSQRSSRVNPSVRKIGDQTRPYAAPWLARAALSRECRSDPADLVASPAWRGRSLLPAREDRPGHIARRATSSSSGTLNLLGMSIQ